MATLHEALSHAAHGAVAGRVDDAVVRLAGPDARRFANGMFTNNIRDLKVGGFCRSFGLDDRGRIVAQLDVHCAAVDAFVCTVEGEVETFVERYQKFLLFDDVDLSHDTDVVLTVQGPSARAAVGLAGLDLVLPRSRSPWGGVDVVVPAHDAEAALLELGRHATLVTSGDLDVLRVMAGQVRWPEDIGEKRLPAELDVRDSHLSFEKGCYIGQESVNRIDVMGKVRRGLALMKVSGEVPAVGTPVTAEGASVGSVTSVASLPGGEGLALAVVRKPHDTPGVVMELGSSRGTVIRRPYRLT